MDSLERVIGDACWAKWGDGPWGTAAEQVECQANAVRTYLESPEVVEVSSEQMWQDESLRARDAKRLIPWDEEADDTREKWRGRARAALSAAGGKQDG